MSTNLIHTQVDQTQTEQWISHITLRKVPLHNQAAEKPIQPVPKPTGPSLGEKNKQTNS